MRRGVGIVALTGASGFVGTALLKALLDGGYRVRALEHRSSLPAHASLTTIRGSLDDASTASQLVDGADVVIHAGGLVVAPHRADFFRVNTHATQALASAARDAKVNRFLFISSLAAREPQLSAYAKSKHEAELLFPSIEGLAWDILRPPAIYGPGDANSLPLLRMLTRGHLWLPVKPAALVSMLHVDDLVAAILAWLNMQTLPQKKTYEIADNMGAYRWDALAAFAAKALARPVVLHQIPPAIAMSMATCTHMIAGVFGKPCIVNPGKVREIAHPDWSVNSEAFMRLTAWRPSVTFETGLANTVAWYQKTSHLPYKM